MHEALDPVSELYHFGIKNMKWGVNRYQLRNGTWTDEGLERRREREGFGQKTITREEVINSGNPKLVSRFRNDLTTQELRSAIDRINTFQTLDAINEKPRALMKARWVNAASKIGKTFFDATTWIASEAGKETLSWLTGEKERQMNWDRIIESGDYDKISKIYDSLPLSYKKKAYDVLQTRHKFKSRSWERDDDDDKKKKEDKEPNPDWSAEANFEEERKKKERSGNSRTGGAWSSAWLF